MCRVVHHVQQIQTLNRTLNHFMYLVELLNRPDGRVDCIDLERLKVFVVERLLVDDPDGGTAVDRNQLQSEPHQKHESEC